MATYKFIFALSGISILHTILDLT